MGVCLQATVVEHLTMYVLNVFDTDLKWLVLHEAVKATCFGINISIPNFYAILEMDCPTSGTFFTPVGKLRMALHEMWEVSNLSMAPSPMRSTSHVLRSWRSWRRMNRPYTRCTEN